MTKTYQYDYPEIHLTEMSILELLDGKTIHDEVAEIIPPTTDELEIFKRCRPIIYQIKNRIKYHK